MEELNKNFLSGQVLNASDMNLIVGKVNEVVREINEGGGSINSDTELSETSTNPVQNKVITRKITELEGQNLLIKLFSYENGIGYKDMIQGKYYNSSGILVDSASFFACKIKMDMFKGKILHVKNLNNSLKALCSWIKTDKSIINVRINAEQYIKVPDDAEYFLVTNNSLKEESLITYNDVVSNELEELDYKSNGFNFTNEDCIEGYYDPLGNYKDSTSFVCKKINVSSLQGEIIRAKLTTNSHAPCSWIKSDLSIENFQVTSEQDIPIPNDAIYLLINNQKLNADGYIQYQTELQKNVENLMNQENEGSVTFYDESFFHVGYFDTSGTEQSSASFVCLKIDVSKYVGRKVYLQLHTNRKAPCSWIKSDGSVDNFVPTGRMILTIPEGALHLACSHNISSIQSGYYVFIEPNTISQYAKGFFRLTNYVGKKLTSYGDSITDFGGWQDIIVNTLGFSSHINCGKAGSTVCLNGVTNMSLCDDARIAELPADTDVLLIMGGTNDFSDGKEIGEQTYDNEDGNTFFGALNIIAKKAITQCPNARIFYMCIYAGKYTYISGWSEDMMVNTAGNTIYDYRNAIKKCAYMHGFPFVDIIGEMGANRYNAEKYFSKDGAYSHPNNFGKEEMAKIIIGKLLTL